MSGERGPTGADELAETPVVATLSALRGILAGATSAVSDPDTGAVATPALR